MDERASELKIWAGKLADEKIRIAESRIGVQITKLKGKLDTVFRVPEHIGPDCEYKDF